MKYTKICVIITEITLDILIVDKGEPVPNLDNAHISPV